MGGGRREARSKHAEQKDMSINYRILNTWTKAASDKKGEMEKEKRKNGEEEKKRKNGE